MDPLGCKHARKFWTKLQGTCNSIHPWHSGVGKSTGTTLILEMTKPGFYVRLVTVYAPFTSHIWIYICTYAPRFQTLVRSKNSFQVDSNVLLFM